MRILGPIDLEMPVMGGISYGGGFRSSLCRDIMTLRKDNYFIVDLQRETLTQHGEVIEEWFDVVVEYINGYHKPHRRVLNAKNSALIVEILREIHPEVFII